LGKMSVRIAFYEIMILLISSWSQYYD
jgi:hypothetical protein